MSRTRQKNTHKMERVFSRRGIVPASEKMNSETGELTLSFSADKQTTQARAWLILGRVASEVVAPDKLVVYLDCEEEMYRSETRLSA